ncbi:MAG: accessory Sec system protein Asp1 [Oenococcus sp.]|uniref:accessory Sec system protein Asp1 n=1 Tax=Oenococcus sp. TaxID=1979414 RepID=UPI0039EA55DF
MIYFVPAWLYSGLRPTDFDDTVHQCQIFSKGDAAIELMMIQYTPNLSANLHTQNLLEIPHWSVFDDIQATHFDSYRALTFDDFNWPAGIEKIYTPFNIVVNYQYRRIGQVVFNDDGQISEISRFQDDLIVEKLLIDSRGFVSSIRHYNGRGRAAYQDYLDLSGHWRIRETLSNGQQSITVNPSFSADFQQLNYENLDQVIIEFTKKHLLQQGSGKNTIILAADPEQDPLIWQARTSEKVILSFFANRYRMTDAADTQLKQEITLAAGLIADEKNNLKRLEQKITDFFPRPEQTAQLAKIYELTPYDTRLQLGQSQREKMLTIYMPIKHISLAFAEEIVDLLFAKMLDNSQIGLFLAISNDDQLAEINTWIKNRVADIFQIVFPDQDANPDASDFQQGENQLTDVQPVDPALTEAQAFLSRVSVKKIQSERAIIASLRPVRLVIDLASETDLFTQIAAISAGIPQINFQASEYVADHKNGLILKKLSDLSAAVDYYFIGLQHWNEALVYSVKQMEKYTDFNLLNHWLEALSE